MKKNRMLQERAYKLNSNLIIVILMITFMLICAIFWILNIDEIVKGSWANILGVIFTFLGAVYGLLQWHAQLTGNKAVSSASPSLCSKASDCQAIATRNTNHKERILCPVEQPVKYVCIYGLSCERNHVVLEYSLRCHVVRTHALGKQVSPSSSSQRKDIEIN